MLRNIWKKYNNSFVFILPMFNDITKGIGIKGAVPHIQYPFIELAVEYGLLNTYLYKNNKYNNILYLEFDKKLLNSSKNITSVKVNSILELLISCKYYEGFYMNSDYIYMMLKIDPKYDNDIKKIEEGKYSEVSPGYLDMINLKQKFVAISKIKECEDISRCV